MSSRRLPGLDGLRALSIGLVVVGHAYHGAWNLDPASLVWFIIGNAALGVEIFFVISGFLITTLLLDEEYRTGGISLCDFYVRRAFRILPALWTYLGAVFLLASVGMLGEMSSTGLLSAFSFTSDYTLLPPSSAVAHTWSLSIEEQFYLLWPPVLAFVLKRYGRRRAAGLVLALVLLAPFIRVATYQSGNAFLAQHLYYTFHTRMDALMFGCLLALVSGTEPFERFYRAAERWIVPLAMFTLFVSPLLTTYRGAYLYTIGYSLEGASIALSILWLVRNPRSRVGRLFNARAVMHIGVISYSLYLWQQLMLKTDFPISSHALAGVLCSLLAAQLSYSFVEQPFLRLRARLARRKKDHSTVSTSAQSASKRPTGISGE